MDATMSTPVTDDRRFMRNMISVMAILLVAGFVAQLALGRSSFAAPAVVHAHAIVFMGWVGITLAQTWLVSAGNLATHRKLGQLAV
ncbi:MAG: hypothetical protein B7Z44_20325, partial [Caulobacter sp. 12-67-6]